MSGHIPEAVLSDSLRDAIGERPVKAAVFLTYQFDPGFFETEILPQLFDRAFSHIERLRLVQVEEALFEATDRVAVYYDRRGLVAGATPARLNVRRIGLARSTGVFHPKVVLVLVESTAVNNLTKEESRSDSLLVMVSSANLTRSGWWENVEAATIDHFNDGDACSYKSDLLSLFSAIRAESATETKHEALEAIRRFIVHRLVEPTTARWNGRLRSRLFMGQKSVSEFLGELVAGDRWNLEVLSPYFDQDGTAATLRDLIEATGPTAVRVSLPQAVDGSIRCTPELFAAIRDLPRVKWGRLPEALMSRGAPGSPRFLHAKVYRFWNQTREVVFLGSVNLTHAAHTSARAGNLEVATLVEPEVGGQARRWWLDEVDEMRRPEFRAGDAEESVPDTPPLTLRYNWMTDTLDYFWESTDDLRRHPAASVAALGVPRFGIQPGRTNAWVVLDAAAASALREVLRSTSLLDVTIEDRQSTQVLVLEEAMAHKPSLLFSLTADQILEYWSLLSPEQREAFLATHEPTLADGTELAILQDRLKPQETFFDRFAGIFHAFSRLAERVNQALEARRMAEAEYRLFGERYDSLPTLIQRVVQDEKADRVNRYVTLLCAQQLIAAVRREHPDFAREHAGELKRVAVQLEAVEAIKAGFTFDSEAARAEFMEWFEDMFFKQLAVAEVDDAD